MKSKSQKIYSSLIATALVASAVVPAASAANITATAKNADGIENDTITIKGVPTGALNIYYYLTSSATAEAVQKFEVGKDVTIEGDSVTIKLSKGFGKETKGYIRIGSKADVEVSVEGTNPDGSTPEASAEALSAAIEVTIPKEASIAPKVADVKTVNNVTLKDLVEVDKLAAKDVVKVYDKATGGSVIGTATARAAGKASVTITNGFGELKEVYVTITSEGKDESAVSEAIEVVEETQTTKPDASKITVSNALEKKSDTVTVLGVKAKDVVNVYSDDKKTVIGTAKVSKAGAAVVKITAGFDETITSEKTQTIYVSVTSDNEKESEQQEVTVEAEATSAAPEKEKITVVNGLDKKSDTVKVTGLEANAVVTVYTKEGTGTDAKYTKLATGKASKTGEALIKVTAGFDEKITADAKGTIGVTVAKAGEKESAKTDVEVGPEEITTLAEASLSFTNNVDIADTLKVAGVEAKDIVKVYEGDSVVATATAKAAGELVVTLKKQFKAADTVKVTRTKVGAKESDKVTVTVGAEPKTTTGAIITNNIAFNDNGTAVATVTIVGAKAKSKYTVYSGTSVVGTATASKAGVLDIKLTKKYSELKDTDLEITLKEDNKEVSDKVKIYKATATTPPAEVETEA